MESLSSETRDIALAILEDILSASITNPVDSQERDLTVEGSHSLFH